ncbi:Hypothetical protein D9617_1g081110 [Elsinoe fawcettii]|nr:Hypothetical protein D9617_1g081110 [Elsinoe fawcettii]
MDYKASHNPFEALSEDLEEEASPLNESLKKTLPSQPTELKKPEPRLTSSSTELNDAQKYAAEKLRRQAERINQSELALEDIMKSKSSSRASRSKKWAPFDFRDTHEESPIRDDISIRSTTTPFDPTAQVFQPIPINLPAREVSFTNLHDTVNLGKVIDDSHWITASRAKVGHTARDENQNPSVSASYNKREINEVFGNELPSPTYCSSHPGTKNGQVVFCIHPNGDVSAQQWSSDHYQWVNIGQYSNSRKKTEGQLASTRVRGESEALSLQQSTLAYFHAIAKQREAQVMGLPFGPKDVQACMPNLSLRRKEPDDTSEPPSHAPVAPAAHYKGLPKPLVALPKQILQRVSPQSEIDASTITKASPLEELQRRGEYLRQLADAQSQMNHLTFGSMTHANIPDHIGTDTRLRAAQGGYPSVILPQHNANQVSSTYHLPFGAYGINDNGHTSNAYASTDSSRRSTFSSQAMSSLFGGGDGITQSRPMSTKPYIPEALQRLAHANSARHVHIASQASMQHIPEEEHYAEQNAYEHYYEQDYDEEYSELTQYPYSVSLIYTKTPCKPPLSRGLTREISHSSIHDLGETEPEGFPQPNHINHQINPSELTRLQDPPTPQHLDGRSVHDTPQISSADRHLSSYDRHLRAWFHNKITLDRHASFYNAIMSHSTDETPTRPSKSKDPGVIGPPSSRKTPTSQKMERHDSLQGSSYASNDPQTKNVGMDKDSTTRLLIPLLENLKGYTQGPMKGRRGYWAPFVDPPEWAVDKGLNGNMSFYEEDWGRTAVPERIGRDWRYRGMSGSGNGGRGTPRRGY